MKRLNIDGYIIDEEEKWIYDWFEIPYITLSMFRAFLNSADKDEIELAINCFGGSVWVGASMYSELRSYGGKSTSKVLGISASASSFMMLGSDKIIASPMATILIHNASCGAEGDYRAMEHAADFLKQTNETIINAYELRTGKSRDLLAKYMDAETLMTAQDALNIGLVDEIDLKEGETLSDNKFSMLATSKMVARFNPQKVQALAERLKPEETASNESGFFTPKPEDEHSTETPEAVSDTQRKLFHNLKKKLFGGL